MAKACRRALSVHGAVPHSAKACNLCLHGTRFCDHVGIPLLPHDCSSCQMHCHAYKTLAHTVWLLAGLDRVDNNT